jgi:hypothetical protein
MDHIFVSIYAKAHFFVIFTNELMKVFSDL